MIDHVPHGSSLRIAKISSLIGSTTTLEMQVIFHKILTHGTEGWEPVCLNIADSGLHRDNAKQEWLLTLPLDHNAKLYKHMLQLDDRVLDLTPMAKCGGECIVMSGCRVLGIYAHPGGRNMPLILDPTVQDETVEVSVSGTTYTINPQDVFDISPGHILFTDGRFLVRGTLGINRIYSDVTCGHGSGFATSMYREESNTLSVVLFEGHAFITEAGIIGDTYTSVLGDAVVVELTLPSSVTDEGGLAMVQNVELSHNARQWVVFGVSRSGRMCVINLNGDVEWLDIEGKCKEVDVISHKDIIVRVINEPELSVSEFSLWFSPDNTSMSVGRPNDRTVTSARSVKVRYDRPCVPQIKSSNS